MKKQEQFSVLNLTRQDVPIITEDIKTRYQWVPVGILDQDDYFGLVTEAYNTSTTNAACVDGVADLRSVLGDNPSDKDLERYISNGGLSSFENQVSDLNSVVGSADTARSYKNLFKAARS